MASYMRPNRRRAARNYLLKQQGGEPFCVHCGITLTLKSMTIDHIVPKSSGGSNSRRNMQASCAPCNKARGNDEDWRIEADIADRQERSANST